ncbi:hypothetical protein [Gordonibacter urolithinfaciens]
MAAGPGMAKTPATMHPASPNDHRLAARMRSSPSELRTSAQTHEK